MGYEVKSIFSSDEIADLNHIFELSPNEKVKRYHNLFYLSMKHNDDLLNPYGQRLKDIFNFTEHRCYFLEYTEGSFTRVHSDAEDQAAKTIVTLIDASDDLCGGETIIYLPHYKQNDYSFDINTYIVKNDSDHLQGAEIIPVVVKMNIGDSVIYDQRLPHEVSLVQQGRRRVLVTWLT